MGSSTGRFTCVCVMSVSDRAPSGMVVRPRQLGAGSNSVTLWNTLHCRAEIGEIVGTFGLPCILYLFCFSFFLDFLLSFVLRPVTEPNTQNPLGSAFWFLRGSIPACVIQIDSQTASGTSFLCLFDEEGEKSPVLPTTQNLLNHGTSGQGAQWSVTHSV